MQNLPRRLNFGSGRSFRDEMLNVDILAARRPDLVLDLGAALPRGRALDCGRFGAQAL